MTRHVDFQILPSISCKSEVLIVFIDHQKIISQNFPKFINHLFIEKLSQKYPKTLDKFNYLDIFSTENEYFERLIMIGIGDYNKFGKNDDWIKLGGSCCSAIKESNNASIIMSSKKFTASKKNIEDFLCGFKLQNYCFDKYQEKIDCELQHLTVSIQTENLSCDEFSEIEQKNLSNAVNFSRDLVNEPANFLGTEEFVSKIKKLEKYNIDIEIFDKNQLKSLGFSGLLNVSKGSKNPPYVAIMKWNGGSPNQTPISLIGKGVVFDSGGISIKSSYNMEDMKGDMAGAATVVGTIYAISVKKIKANVIGIVGLVENMPDGNSMRPGDIIKSMSGKTIEVVNTDAEGRIILSDLLFFAKENIKPKIIIDIATLTGSIVEALGEKYAGLFSNDEVLAKNLYDIGILSGENLWRMPLCEEYDGLIDSKIADIRNSAKRGAGSITAAQFLKRFVGNTPWAHLDIAGTSTKWHKNEYNQSSWASGFGVRLLEMFIEEHYQEK